MFFELIRSCRVVAVLALCMLAFANRARAAAEPARPTFFGAAFYLQRDDDAAKALDKQIEDWAALESPELKVLRERPAGRPAEPTVLVQHPTLEQAGRVTEQELKLFGRALTPEQQRAVIDAKSVVGLFFMSAGGDRALPTVRAANKLLLRVSRETKCVIYDTATREYFSDVEWERRRVASWSADGQPDVAKHITVHQYSPDNSPLVRLISLGMGKFGRDDLVINGASRHDADSSGALLNLAAQTLVEGPDALDRAKGTLHVNVDALRHAEVRERNKKSYLDGATGDATLTVAEAKREDGDPENALLELTFAAGGTAAPGATVHERRDAVLAHVFGSRESPTVEVEHDAKILAASARARARLPELAKRFAAGLAPGERLLLKAPFKTTKGNNEWMWVEVTQWADGSITALLANDPFDVADLKAGATVHVKESDVFDYYLVKPDGKIEGNETGQILEKRSR